MQRIYEGRNSIRSCRYPTATSVHGHLFHIQHSVHSGYFGEYATDRSSQFRHLTMNNSNDSHDLQLEDVEDFATSGYPNSDYPPTEENVAVGSFDGPMKSSRVSRVSYLVRKHKWATALVFIIFVIAIVILAIVGGSKPEETGNKSGQNAGLIHIDPKSLDPKVTEALMEQLLGAYSRKGLSTAPLEANAGVTPQKKAFYWLAANTGVLDMEHTELMQRYTMAVFYYSTNAVKTPWTADPKPWLSATSWLSITNVCEWRGIKCNGQNHIEEITLPQNNLSGRLPMELWFISATLHAMDLTTNLVHMSGDMYNVFTQMTQIHTLMLDDNFLEYPDALPPQLKNMERLRKIVLSHNLFSGELERVHKVLPSWSQLTHLEIESTYLSGTLPTFLGQMTNLVYLYLRDNELSTNLDFLKSGKLTELCKFRSGSRSRFG